MSVTVTSLVHPTMIAKIRLGLRYAALNQGDKMNGHGRRVYIANAKGHNILRIDWKGQGKFIAYGRESKDVTEMVKKALRMANVKPVHTYTPGEAVVTGGPVSALKMMALGLGCAVISGCSAPGAMTAVVSILGSLLT
jgi:hypothetical protein